MLLRWSFFWYKKMTFFLGRIYEKNSFSSVFGRLNDVMF